MNTPENAFNDIDVTAKTTKPETVQPSGIPCGPGRLVFEKTAWAQLGFTGTERIGLMTEIKKLGGIYGKPSDKTKYLIYAPNRAPHLKYWSEAQKREEEGTLILLTPTLFQLWKADSFVKAFKSLTDYEKRNTVFHYLSHPEQWENCREACAVLTHFIFDSYISLLNSLFYRKDFNLFFLLINMLCEKEIEWKQTGYSDGLFTLFLLNSYYEKVIALKDMKISVAFLDFKNRRFTQEEIEEAKKPWLDYEVGLSKQPRVYWAPGTIHTFGRYYQDTDKRKVPLEWQVLDAQNEKVLLLSRYGLDAKPYHSKWTNITWEQSSLREWLNKEFLYAAFDESEQSRIKGICINNNETYGFNEGNKKKDKETVDWVFLLSEDEVKYYFRVTRRNDQNLILRVAPTKFAKKNGAKCSGYYRTDEDNETGRWWLSSPGDSQSLVSIVDYDGSFDDSIVIYDDIVVRPALWVEIK